MKPAYISEALSRFKVTGNPIYAADAVKMVVRQRRSLELAFGLCCWLAARPSAVTGLPDHCLDNIVSDCSPWLRSGHDLTRQDVVVEFGRDFAVNRLPADFASVRREGIAFGPGLLMIGEYGEGARRIFQVTGDTCSTHSCYDDDPRVRHIHAVHRLAASGDFLVTTGDAARYLDLWALRDGRLSLKSRLRKRLAGHTAIAEAGGKCFLGTDFSTRPNWLEVLGGKRYFFPPMAAR
jgi:hypothetical protein